MKEMTTYERVTRMFEHKEADRAPVVDYPWSSTIECWHREGMPAGVDYKDFFGLDKIVLWEGLDNSPRYPEKVLEQCDEWVVKTTKWGVTLKQWKHTGGVPEFLDFTIVDPDSWAKAKARMTPSKDRIDWATLRKHYKQWRADGAWLSAYFWFGFDVTHSWTVGTERVLMALVEQPEWMADMFNHFLDVQIALYEIMLAEGCKFDEIQWPDDMGYKHNQFFSLELYREILKPVHKRAIDWAHSKGLKTQLHSCGDVNPFVPDLIDIGIDMLNPLEVKAGMDPIALKNKYGDKLAFRGGLNAVLFERPDELWAEMRRVIPALKQNGGLVISSDHSVPESVSLKEFQQFVTLAKELGAYK
jgi:uroporphyrinogen decarboxylase